MFLAASIIAFVTYFTNVALGAFVGSAFIGDVGEMLVLIAAQILKPLVGNIGINEIQLCVIMITALGVGFIMSPLGLNLLSSPALRESRSSRSPRALGFLFTASRFQSV